MSLLSATGVYAPRTLRITTLGSNGVETALEILSLVSKLHYIVYKYSPIFFVRRPLLPHLAYGRFSNPFNVQALYYTCLLYTFVKELEAGFENSNSVNVNIE